MYIVTIEVEGWLAKVTEWVRANTEQEAIEEIEKHSIYPLENYKITKIEKV